MVRYPTAVKVRMDLDSYVSLKGLAGYFKVSRLTFQALVYDSEDSIPFYLVGSKIFVRRSEFDAWRTGAGPWATLR